MGECGRAFAGVCGRVRAYAGLCGPSSILSPSPPFRRLAPNSLPPTRRLPTSITALHFLPLRVLRSVWFGLGWYLQTLHPPQVATRRVKQANKAEVPLLDDHVSKIEHIGRETVKKLADVVAAAKELNLTLQVRAVKSVIDWGKAARGQSMRGRAPAVLIALCCL